MYVYAYTDTWMKNECTSNTIFKRSLENNIVLNHF